MVAVRTAQPQFRRALPIGSAGLATAISNLWNGKPMRQLAKTLSVRATTAAYIRLSEPDNLGVDVRSLGFRIISVLDLTKDVLRRSGIKRGMRVLDLECGAGDVSLTIARLTGASGLVVGVDRSAEAIDIAERQATVAGCCYWMRFVTAEPDSLILPERFDAVIVRLSRFRQEERATLRRLSAYVRPGGVAICQASITSGNTVGVC